MANAGESCALQECIIRETETAVGGKVLGRVCGGNLTKTLKRKSLSFGGLPCVPLMARFNTVGWRLEKEECLPGPDP